MNRQTLNCIKKNNGTAAAIKQVHLVKLSFRKHSIILCNINKRYTAKYVQSFVE